MFLTLQLAVCDAAAHSYAKAPWRLLAPSWAPLGGPAHWPPDHYAHMLIPRLFLCVSSWPLKRNRPYLGGSHHLSPQLPHAVVFPSQSMVLQQPRRLDPNPDFLIPWFPSLPSSPLLHLIKTVTLSRPANFPSSLGSVSFSLPTGSMSGPCCFSLGI